MPSCQAVPLMVSKRLTAIQRANETTYGAGERKGRILERKRIIRLLTARVDPYDDNCQILRAIRRIQPHPARGRMSRALTLIPLAWLIAGCVSPSPTAPSPTPWAMPSPAPLLKLAWHRTAPGCTPTQPAPDYAQRAPDRALLLAPDQLRALYLERVDRTGPRTVEIYTVADFAWDNGWALCDWSEQGRTQIAGVIS